MKYFIYSVLLCLGISFFSCSKFLEENPKGTLTDNNFYKTEADADAAVVAAYDGLNDQWSIYFRGIYMLAELPTDNAECGQGVANSFIFALDQSTYGPVNDRIEQCYSSIYKTIANANVALDRIPDIDFDETKKNRLLGEVRFIRGLLYFNLVRLFGAVPLVLHQVPDINHVNQARDSVKVVYQQIIEDLKFGETYLEEVNNSSNQGRATKAAASGLLAKVYLTLHQYDSAKIEAKKVLDLPANEYGLLDNYAEIFSSTNRFNKELIFTVQNKGNTGTANGFGQALFLPRSTIPLPGGGYVAGNSADVPTEEFYNSFKAGDKRKDKTFFTSYNAGAGAVTFRPHWYKFFDPSAITNLGQGSLNFPIIRYADILLTYGEALNELQGPTSEAYKAINQVRRRAYGEPINLPAPGIDLEGLSQTGLRDAFLEERRWEFGFEDQRWFDLVRTGKFLSVLKAKGLNVKEYQQLFPLPQRDLDVNRLLTQNPGYTL